MEEKKENKFLKIIITVSVIIILLFAVGFGIYYTINTINKPSEKNEVATSNELEANEIEQIEEAEKVVNNEIIENETDELNKKYGRVDIVWVDKNNKIIAKPLEPVLKGMVPVKYSDEEKDFVETTKDDTTWYNYENQRWANAMDNESYFVWIPRYAYKITYYSDSTYSKEIGYSDSRGILKVGENDSLIRIDSVGPGLTEVGNHYILAPAFSRDTASGYKNGGWDGNLSGIWVSKYEMSMEKDGNQVETVSSKDGNVFTSDSIKAVSKPGVSSWRNIKIGVSYINAYNYNRDLESHLIKNSEWAAVSYLSYSKYGRNGGAVSINSNSKYLTGGNNLKSEIYIYNGKQSTTGNYTGIYDMSGGAWEFISAFINNTYEGLITYGGNGTGNLCENSRNTKYKTVYSIGNMEKEGHIYNSAIANENYLLTRNRRGEAIYETSTSGYGTDSWNTSSSFYPQRDTPFFARGGDFSSGTGAGIFSFNPSNGQADAGVGFRVALVCE